MAIVQKILCSFRLKQIFKEVSKYVSHRVTSYFHIFVKLWYDNFCGIMIWHFTNYDTTKLWKYIFNRPWIRISDCM